MLLTRTAPGANAGKGAVFTHDGTNWRFYVDGDVFELEPRAVDVLVAHGWPGNVRELENVITRLVLESPGRTVNPGAVSASLAGPAGLPARTLAQIEREAVRAALESTGWNYGRACRALGISRPTLRRKVARYGLTRP